MTKQLAFWFNAILVLSMLLVPFTGAQSVAAAPGTPQEVPAEVQAMFANGMSIDEFIQLNGGEVPHALADFVSQPVAVIIELEQAPVLAKAQETRMARAAQISYRKQLEQVQAALEPKLVSRGATIMGRYTMVYNGFLAQVPSKQLSAIQALPYVKAIHRAPEDVPTLGNSVPLIGAPEVWHNLGVDGTGINVAVVDTGIDYTHVVFGGNQDYAVNDPTTIETGTFPTAKVVGGYDFAGTNYDAGSKVVTDTIPFPDPDPLDEGGHGTHVASTIAGIAAGQVMTGVAPMAKLYALKVFGKEGSTNLVVNALEWIATHNLSATTEADKIGVVNMSLGSTYGPNDPADPEMVAVKNLTNQGVVLAISAGNSGDVPYIVGSPSVADSAISVAASTTGYATGPTLGIKDTTVPTLTNILYNVPAFDGGTGHYTETVTATLYYVGKLGIDDDFCDTSAVSTTTELQGKVALIQRGACAFTQKVNNAAALGAIGAIIFNDAARGDALVTMAGTPVQIPAGFIGHTDGMNLATAHGQTVVVSKESDIQTVASKIPADTIADFSSRGPRGYDSKLKPEITAPGVAIFAAKMGSGNQGVSMSGTSMAAPHMAGVAALMKKAHPNWTVEQIKAALMNTAKCIGVPIPRGGAGRVQVDKAAATRAVAVGDEDLVSLSYGVVASDQAKVVLTKTIRLYSWYTATHAYTVSAVLQTGSITDGVTINVPPTVDVTANGEAVVPVTMTVDMTKIPVGVGSLEEVYGFVIFTDAAKNTLRVPFYMVPRPYSKMSTVDKNMTISNWTTDVATITLQESGAITTYVEAHSVLITSTNDISQTDMGDVKYVAMDYGWKSGFYGDVADVIIATWGSHHTPQPTFGEMDLYIDANGDGSPDLVDFNWNYGAYGGGGDTDTWIVAQVDLATGKLSLASPYLIYTDYNAGYMEWFLPALWNAPQFTFQVVGFDVNGRSDPTDAGYFDIVAPQPLAFTVHNSEPGPASRLVNIDTRIASMASYGQTQPKGLMVMDYSGEPGNESCFVPLQVSAPQGGQIAISKSVSPGAVDMDATVSVFTYTVKLTNQISTTASTVLMEDTLPPQLVFGSWVVSPTAGTTQVSNGKITWSGDVAGDSAVTFIYTMKPVVDTMTIVEPIANTATFDYIGGSGSATAIVSINHYIYLPLVVRNYPAP